MAACFEVFATWDDEYEKLQGLLRDIVKKKREESMKMVWRVNPAHKRLQARLDQMRKYATTNNIDVCNNIGLDKIPVRSSRASRFRGRTSNFS
mgnify:FL=1